MVDVSSTMSRTISPWLMSCVHALPVKVVFAVDAKGAANVSWTPLQDTFAAPFASTANTTFTGRAWTQDISHGEMVRDIVDETSTIDTCHLQYLYQGVDPAAPNDAGYNGIPWQ